MLPTNPSSIERGNPFVHQLHQPASVYKQSGHSLQQQLPFEDKKSVQKRSAEIALYDIPTKRKCKMHSVNNDNECSLPGTSECLNMNTKGN